MSSTASRAGAWSDEAAQLLRAAAGGLLFGVPLLFTMEVWWIGGETTPTRTLLALALTAVPIFLLNRTDGFRSSRDVRLADAVFDTVVAMAVALVSVAALLVMLREIRLGTPLDEALGKIVYEATPFSIGIGLSRHFLSGSRDGEDDDTDGEGGDATSERRGTLVDLGAALIGSVFVAFSIAPTDEVPLLVAAMSPAWVLGILVASLLVSYVVVFEAGLADEKGRHRQEGLFQRPLTETVVSYLLGLASAAVMLWFFQRLDGLPFDVALDHVVVLGFPAAVGGAAGRLVV